MSRARVIVGVVALVVAVAAGAFIGGRVMSRTTTTTTTTAAPAASHAATTTTEPPLPPNSATVSVVKCPTAPAGEVTTPTDTTAHPSDPGFEPPTLRVRCGTGHATVSLWNIVWTTWGSVSAHGVGTLTYYTTSPTKKNCVKFCGTEIPGVQTPTDANIPYCPGHLNTPTWTANPYTTDPAFCGLTTAPTTACSVSTERQKECPTRLPVYAPIGTVKRRADVTLSNPIRQTKRLVWGTIVANAICSTGAAGCGGPSYRTALPAWGMP